MQCEGGEKNEDKSSGVFGFSHLMSGVSSITRLVETTGSKVLTGGLDTLETIGKKTMEVLQEGDPGLKNKRALFSEKTVLSQVYVLQNTCQHLCEALCAVCALCLLPQSLICSFITVKLLSLEGIPAFVQSRLFVYLFVYSWFIDRGISISEITLNSGMIIA